MDGRAQRECLILGLRLYVTLALFLDSLASGADGYRSMHPPCGSQFRLPHLPNSQRVSHRVGILTALESFLSSWKTPPSRCLFLNVQKSNVGGPYHLPSELALLFVAQR
ncbi:hypothetical protein C8R43DRAFT_504914 [Mycena crocata]|nr:hypothetical protein C8R43DRAFT_504914 [Mycena crocata]